MKTTVKNLESTNGNKVANQFIIYTDNGRIFQSYDSVIVEIKNSEVTLDEYYWNYSKTTSKYRNIFLGETTKETEAKIKNGTYKLAKLN